MRFRRAQVRYSDTPEPVTPYQAAAQAWDERIGSARVQAKNWRLMAFGCLFLAMLMAGGLVWRSAQSIVTPFVVEVDRTGQVRAVGVLRHALAVPVPGRRRHRRAVDVGGGVAGGRVVVGVAPGGSCNEQCLSCHILSCV